MSRIAYPYLRFSSTEQSKGDSTRRQSTWHVEIAQREGWILDTSLKLEDKGRSAFHGDHLKHDLGRFLSAINDGTVKPGSVLLFEELDRLSRQPVRKAFPLFVGILSAGVDIRTRERLYTETDLDDLGTLLGIIVKQSTATDESRKKSMRITEVWRGWKSKIANGEKTRPPGRMPPWVKWDGKELQLIPGPTAAIRLIFKLAGEGLGMRRILDKLNEDNVPTIGRCPTWRLSYIAKLLNWKIVMGGLYPAVVSEEEFYRARGALSKKQLGQKGTGREGESITNLFTGLIRDSRDGELCHINDKGAKGTGRHLVSSGTLRRAKGSRYLSFPYADVERAFLKKLKELKVSDLTGESDADEVQIQSLEGRKSEIERTIAATKKRIALGQQTESLLDLLGILDGQKGEITAELDRLQAQRATRQPSALTEAQSLVELLDSAEGEAKRDLRAKLKVQIRRLVSEIWILVWQATTCVRCADVQIQFHTGKVRHILLQRFVNGSLRGAVHAVTGESPEGQGEGSGGFPNLSLYRSAESVQNDVDERHSTWASGLERAGFGKALL